MLHHLNVEWLKIRRYKAFLILSVFYALGLFVLNYIVYSVFDNVVKNSQAGALIDQFNPFAFDHVWQTVSYASGYLLLMPALLMILLVTNEYTYRTNRQNIIDGWSRAESIQVKWMLMFIFSMISTILVIMVGFIFGWMSGTDFSWNGFSHIGYFFLKTVSYLMLAILLGVWLKRTGIAIGAYFLYLGGENILAQILDVFSMKIKQQYKTDLGSMGDYLPMNASDGLLTFPENPLKSMAESSLPTQYSTVSIICAIFYLALFLFLSDRSVRKRDL
jgi:ABC-2 type transport system permease protein